MEQETAIKRVNCENKLSERDMWFDTMRGCKNSLHMRCAMNVCASCVYSEGDGPKRNRRLLGR